MPDGVHAQFGLRTVGGEPGQFKLEPGESAVGDGQFQAARLNHQGGVGMKAAQHLFGADAAELLVAHRGFAWYELELTGLAAHGSQPELGVDAIWQAGRALAALDGLRQRLRQEAAHSTLGHGAVRVSKIVGGDDAATVAARCVLTLERRMLPGQSPEQVEAELLTLFTELAGIEPEFQFTLTRLVARAAFEAAPQWPIVRALGAHAERVLGHPAATRGEPFWTDAGLILEAGIDCVVFGADGEGLHADTEWADAQSVRALAEILAGTITEFCGPPAS